MISPLVRKLLAEGLGTMLLLAVVIGSGIMAEHLSAGNAAVALLANTAATVGALYVLIEVFGPVSGAHFNPVVSAALAWRRQMPWRDLVPYIAVQLIGAVLGAWLANAMFDLAIVQTSCHVRSGIGQWIAEVVATAGLLLTILRAPASKVSSLVAAFIGAAYWFTSSTSFANPAAVLGRMFSDTFAGISPNSTAGFVIAEGVGAVIGLAVAETLRERS
jgi:glycerol uptake facilitator-like aquaporin